MAEKNITDVSTTKKEVQRQTHCSVAVVVVVLQDFITIFKKQKKWAKTAHSNYITLSNSKVDIPNLLPSFKASSVTSNGVKNYIPH